MMRIVPEHRLRGHVLPVSGPGHNPRRHSWQSIHSTSCFFPIETRLAAFSPKPSPTVKGRGRFTAYSAGLDPASELDPVVLDILRLSDYPTEGLRPKHWKEFTRPDAPPLRLRLHALRSRSRRAAASLAGAARHGRLELSRSRKNRGRRLGTAQGAERDAGRPRAAVRHLQLFAVRVARRHEPAAGA